MSEYHWLKLWVDILNDWKIAPLPDRLWRRFIECCLIAKRLDDGGFLESIERMAFILHLTPDELEQDLAALEKETRVKDKPGVVQCLDGRWHVTNLEKRQAAISSTERTRRWRARNRDDKYRETGRGRDESGTKAGRKRPQDNRGSEDRGSEDQRIRGSDEQTADSRDAAPGRPAPVAAAAVLAGVHELGITDPKASRLVDDYLERGELAELLPRLESWIECYEDKPGIDNVLGLAIRQAENGLDPPQDGDEDYWARFARQQKAGKGAA